jgi:hypothetical protein
VVYGSRFLAPGPKGTPGQRAGNRVLTALSNVLNGTRLSDVYVCYKVFRRDVLRGLALREDRFGFEPEVTAKVARGRWRVREVAVTYTPRSRRAGKKITWKDALLGIWYIIRYRLAD